MAEIAITNLSKIYADGTVAVEDLTLTVADGEFLVLVGPSGCGKSTVLRCVAGLEEPSRGSISLDGQMVQHLPPQARNLAMVFQSYALYPHMNVYENLAFGLKMQGRPREEIQRRVGATAEKVGLSPLLQKRPRELSGGERQRVALGRAIVRQPQAFLMDEPLSNLDAALRVRMRMELLKLQQDLHITVLYVTHDQTEAMTMGNRVAVLDRGRLQQVAPPGELYARPANRFVAGFIGSPAMNFISARLHEGDGQTRLSFGGQSLSLPADYLKRRPELMPYFDRTIILGLRPEVFTPVAPGAPEVSSLSVRVELVETLGAVNYLHFYLPDPLAPKTGPVAFTASLDPHLPVTPGQDLEMAIDPGRCHFFDPDNGEAL